jgi:hypothetical protein
VDAAQSQRVRILNDYLPELFIRTRRRSGHGSRPMPARARGFRLLGDSTACSPVADDSLRTQGDARGDFEAMRRYVGATGKQTWGPNMRHR